MADLTEASRGWGDVRVSIKCKNRLFPGNGTKSFRRKAFVPAFGCSESDEYQSGGGLMDSTDGLSLSDAMKLELSYRAEAAQENDIPVTVQNGPWLQKIRELLSHPAFIEALPVEPSFQAGLRPYQDQGYH